MDASLGLLYIGKSSLNNLDRMPLKDLRRDFRKQNVYNFSHLYYYVWQTVFSSFSPS